MYYLVKAMVKHLAPLPREEEFQEIVQAVDEERAINVFDDVMYDKHGYAEDWDEGPTVFPEPEEHFMQRTGAPNFIPDGK